MRLRRLRYEISDWSQATQALSNNCKELKIRINKFLHSPDLEGRSISVTHPLYGVLFCAMIEGQGTLISEQDECANNLPYMTTAEILVQLEKLGFDIDYREDIHLDGDQLTFINNLLELGFDTLTKIVIKTEKTHRTTVIAFNSLQNQKYLTYGIEITKAEFDRSLEEGHVANISRVGKHLPWDWLTYTVKIADLLKANSTQDEEVIPDIIPLEEKEMMENLPHLEITSQEPVAPESPVNTSEAIPADSSQFHTFDSIEVSDEEWEQYLAQQGDSDNDTE